MVAGSTQRRRGNAEIAENTVQGSFSVCSAYSLRLCGEAPFLEEMEIEW